MLATLLGFSSDVLTAEEAKRLKRSLKGLRASGPAYDDFVRYLKLRIVRAAQSCSALSEHDEIMRFQGQAREAKQILEALENLQVN